LSERFTGFRTFTVPPEIITALYAKKEAEPWDKRHSLYPNMYLELRSQADIKNTALARVGRDGTLHLIASQKVSSIEPRNREQVFAFDALLNDEITAVVLTGTAGTGKTILTLAAALEKVRQDRYEKVILTRPMSHVGKYSLGALPGDVTDKFQPYLLNYLTNLEQFVGNKHYIKDLLDQNRFEIVPLQLVRGASFKNSLVIADEMQVCDQMEILTIGTRVGEGSKIVLMGDLNQRDEKIAKEKTGLHKMMHDRKVKESHIVATIELQKCERSKTARLFAEVFEG